MLGRISMRKFTKMIALALMLTGAKASACDIDAQSVGSPDGRIEVDFCLKDTTPGYKVRVGGKQLLDWSALGFMLKDKPALANGFAISQVTRDSHRETWEQPWGEERYILDHHNEMRVTLTETSGLRRHFDVVFRVFNEGVGFRYEIPAQQHLQNFTIMRELTEFNFPQDHKAWWIPGLVDNHYEHLFTKTRLSKIPFIHTPVTIEAGESVVAIHEANLTDYASFVLRSVGGGKIMTELVPWNDGTAVKAVAPMQSSWRTLQIGRTANDLINNYMILNLNDPNQLSDVSWIKPQKMLGVWWGMHLGKWDWAPGPRHGATTERTMQYIDYAAQLKIPAVLVEGWNVGWEVEWGNGFSFTKSYPDFDLAAVTAYAKSKGVELVGHHETGGAITNYENQAEAGFALYQRMGVHAVKTGYVANKVEGGEWHGGQRMVRHYRHIAELAARYDIMIDAHEPVKDTGVRRTLPNFMTREGARGMEYAAWGGPNGFPPDHTTILPYTRMLGGPFDITPGIFDLMAGQRPGDRTRTTLAKQLALYVVIFSPIHMAADLPENYVDHPAFKFIQDVPTDWFTSRALNGEIGEYTTIVRRDRNSDDWYLGSITDENAREVTVNLDFLNAGEDYCAEMYRDRSDTDFEKSPATYEIVKQSVRSGDQLRLRLARGGGQAIRFVAHTNCN